MVEVDFTHRAEAVGILLENRHYPMTDGEIRNKLIHELGAKLLDENFVNVFRTYDDEEDKFEVRAFVMAVRLPWTDGKEVTK
jgi:CRISPR/Cas system-associated endonuclease Cas3-HD